MVDINCTYEPVATSEIVAAIRSGAIPEIYRMDGELVHVYEDENAPVPGTQYRRVTTDVLRDILHQDADCYKIKTTQQNVQRLPAFPGRDALNTVLANVNWSGVPVLRGITYTPSIRPDGSVITSRGYDPATGIWCDPRGFSERHLRELSWDWNPNDEDDFRESYVFEEQAINLLDSVLGDFPWKSDADRANYLALMFTPLLRTYMPGALAPMGVISATAPASGKTLLTQILTALYGGVTNAWVRNDEELAKVITTNFMSTAPVVTFDNISEKHELASPILAKLLTDNRWAGRELGSTRMIDKPNDKLWLATGNNVTIGGDMATRVIMVELDPAAPNPEARASFRLGDLTEWLQHEQNILELKYALIFLARLWLTRGRGQRGSAQMRSFTRWGSVMSGLLSELRFHGFLSNTSRVAEEDVEAAEWEAFLMRWYEINGNRELKTNELHASIVTDTNHWGDAIILDRNGEPLNRHALAIAIGRRVGRWCGQYRVLKREGPARAKFYRVVQFGHETDEVPGRDLADLDTAPKWMKE
jgi:hypothetical protein